jgi:hypothetical protein
MTNSSLNITKIKMAYNVERLMVIRNVWKKEELKNDKVQ